MTTKNCDIQVNVRDPESGEVIATNYAMGTTDDDGVTCVVPIGYLPSIASAAPADIIMNVIPPATHHEPVGFVSRVDDVEAGTSTVTFNLAP